MTIDLTKLITVEAKRAAAAAATLEQARASRQPIISMLDGMQASAVVLGNLGKAQAIETAKQGLRDITKTDLSTCATADQMKAAIMIRYRGIAAVLPADVVAAFKAALA